MEIVAQLLETLIVASVGGFVVHILTARRDKANSQLSLERAAKIRITESRIEYLRRAYADISEYVSIFNSPKGTDRGSEEEQNEREARFNRAVNDLLLVGSKPQIELLKSAMIKSRKTIAQNMVGHLFFDDLCVSLRDELRAELGLEKIDLDHMEMRIRRDRTTK